MSTRTAPRTGRGLVQRIAAGAMAFAAVLGLSGCAGQTGPEVKIGLITKQEDNPYWVEMRQVAERTASQRGATLISAAGTSDVDVAGQQAALESMIADGVDGILIAPTDSELLDDAIAQARADGILVIVLDTPLDSGDAADAFFATDNLEAGRLLGEYAAARAAQEGLVPQVAMLNLAPGIASGEDRHAGFLAGFGLTEDSAELVAQADTQGNQELGEEAFAAILAANPGVNVVYTVNEPAALGALDALRAAGRDASSLVLVSIDGGCVAMKGPVRSGQIAATVQQFPQNMAREGVNAIVEYVREGTLPPNQLDTGIQLITDHPVEGVASRDTAFGVRNCWG